MRKIEMFVCDKCHESFATGSECRKHEEVCGELQLIEIFLSVRHSNGILIDSAVITANRIGVDTFRVCERLDDDGYPLTREVTLMDPEVEDVDMDGYGFTIRCTEDQKLDAELKLRDYAKKVLKDQRSKLDMMLRKLEEV